MDSNVHLLANEYEENARKQRLWSRRLSNANLYTGLLRKRKLKIASAHRYTRKEIFLNVLIINHALYYQLYDRLRFAETKYKHALNTLCILKHSNSGWVINFPFPVIKKTFNLNYSTEGILLLKVTKRNWLLQRIGFQKKKKRKKIANE